VADDAKRAARQSHKTSSPTLTSSMPIATKYCTEHKVTGLAKHLWDAGDIYKIEQLRSNYKPMAIRSASEASRKWGPSNPLKTTHLRGPRAGDEGEDAQSLYKPTSQNGTATYTTTRLTSVSTQL
jgi:hypothetical protein